MSAAITDKFKKGYGFFSTTLSAQKNSGASSMSLSDATGVPTTTGLVFTVGRVNSSGTSTPSTRAIYKGTLSGTTVSNLTLTEGTDQTHAAGTVVEITFTATHWNDAVDGILVEHNQDGTHGAITSTGATLTSPKVVTAINDSAGNELFKVTATGSAVNELTVANAATGNNPTLSATGGDTNVGIALTPKGTGYIVHNGPTTNKYCFRAIDSGGTTLTDATHVQIALATEVYDYNNNFASSTYTAPVAGVYHFDGGVTITGNVATGVSFWCSVWVDGVEYIRGPRITPGNNNGVGVSADVPLTVGQAVTLRAYQDSAGNEATETGTGATFFNGHLIHAV